MHYILEVSRYTSIVYLGRHLVLTDIYRNIFFNSLLLFFSYICWSVNYMSWISKLHNFFLTCLETEARFIFEGFKYCLLQKVNFHISATFLAFFIWSVDCSRDFFSLFCQSVNCMSWVLEWCNTSRRCPEV